MQFLLWVSVFICNVYLSLFVLHLSFFRCLRKVALCNCLFVCVEVLWPSQPNGVISIVVSLPYHTFTGQAVLQAVNQYCAHSFARNLQMPFLNQRKGEKIFHDQTPWKNVADPAGVESATSWSPVRRDPTEPPRPASWLSTSFVSSLFWYEFVVTGFKGYGKCP